VAPAARRLEAALPAAGRAVRYATGWAAARLAGDARRQERAQARADHMRELCGRIATFLAPSAFLRDRFVAFGVAASRIRTWALGIDHARFTRVERSHTGPLRIGFLGSLMISKAPHVLLEAFARLPAGAATVTLIGSHAPYHGDDSYRSRVEPLLRLAGVRQLGAVPHEQIPAALASLDVLVVPSIWPENSPLVIREAFLSGLPVIASRIGGIPEIVEDGRNGRLFEPGNADALSRILRSLAEDPAGVARLRAGIPAVRTIEDDIAETEIVYRAAMQEAGA
jgi:glycosyltransferase involved in cell wall biosynthesis